MLSHMGGKENERKRTGCSGVCGIDDGFVRRHPSSVPAAIALLLLDAGIVL